MPDPPPVPWIIYGVLKNYIGAVIPGILITATNLTTSDTQTDTTNALGEYTIDAANFASGYSDGDIITITCTYDNSLCTIDVLLFGYEVNLQEAPPAPSGGYEPVWSYGRSVIAQSVDYWSYGESGHYRYLGGGGAVSCPGTSPLDKLIAFGLL